MANKRIPQHIASSYIQTLDLLNLSEEEVIQEVMKEFDVDYEYGKKLTQVYLFMGRQFTGMTSGSIDRRKPNEPRE